MISGYQGSPLGGFDKELARNRKLVEEHHVRHVPGLNEELGATSAWGSQLASQLPGAKYDGVLAMWYGKAPGLDRAADSLRHGNFVGVPRTGGALAIVGDDPGCKSSTIPSASESLLASLQMPVFFPGNVQEVLDLGLHALACSRASGLWSGFKIVTSVADAVGTAAVSPDRVLPVMPTVEWNGKPYEHVPNANLLAPASLDMERTLFGPRTELALAYARENGLNRIEGARAAWLGIVAPGKTYYDLMHALRELGLDGSAPRARRHPHPEARDDLPARAGDRARVRARPRRGARRRGEGPVRGDAPEGRALRQRGRPAHPRQARRARRAAAPARARPRRRPDRPRASRPASSARGVRIDSVEARLRKLAEIHGRPAELPMAQRTPFFCSGCPHNSSVKAPEGTLVGGGIGCHTMVLLNPEGKGEITGITQMGGEGAQWIGMAPFTDDSHLVQNLGDGTFHHSGSLAVRAAVAAGVNITYKLLYNEHVAMTGGQAIEGQLSVPDLTRWLELEGVRRIIVTTEDTSRYRGVELASIAELRDRKELLASQQELAERRGRDRPDPRPGVRRRAAPQAQARQGARARGARLDQRARVRGLRRLRREVELPLGPAGGDRVRAQDADPPGLLQQGPLLPRRATAPPSSPSCRARRRSTARPTSTSSCPSRERLVGDEDFGVRMMGIGGTGVVTVNQMLGMAALLDGLHVSGLDQTGLSQKGGPVISDLRITREPLAAASKTPAGSVDLYLGFDLLGAGSEKNLLTADRERTVAVVSTSAVPTGRMVIDVNERFPELAAQLDKIDAATRSEHNLYLDAQQLSERLFGDHMMTNTLALGAAYQRGLLPVSGEALERAIELNGAAVEKNLAALRWGRAVVAAPDAVEAATRPPEAVEAVHELSDTEHEIVALAVNGDRGELRRIAEVRVPELVAYQDADWARRWAELVRRVHVAEQERTPGHSELAEAVARQLFKLMAYKDEYEVARLHLDAVERAKLGAEFGEDAQGLLHAAPAAAARARAEAQAEARLAGSCPRSGCSTGMRRLRGTRLDPFGRAEVRRVERELIDRVRGAWSPRRSHCSRRRPTTRRRAARAAGRDPRLRGDQAAQRHAVPQARRRDPEAPARRQAGA